MARSVTRNRNAAVYLIEGMNRERFLKLWDRCPIEDEKTDPSQVYDLLVGLYATPWRRYHTAAHLDHCLALFDRVRGKMDDPDAVEMALWFHDAIYDTRAEDNEDRSADLFDAEVGCHADDAFREKVIELILVTSHGDPPWDRDTGFIVDIDLSSFGLPWDDFMEDSSNVRKEYAHLSDSEFHRGQLRFFRHLLTRPSFFSTPYFRHHYEDQARSNLKRKIEGLAERGYA